MDGDAGATSPPRQLASSRWRFGAMVRPEQSYVHAGGAKGSCWRVGVSFCALLMAECHMAHPDGTAVHSPPCFVGEFARTAHSPCVLAAWEFGLGYFAFCVVRGGG